MSSLKQHIKIAKRNTLITPRLHAWLTKNGEVKIEDDEMADRVREILSPSSHDRSGVFHPSQLYQCQRRQLFEYLGMDKKVEYNPTLQNLFNDGHFRHLRWQIMLLNAGILSDIEVSVQIPELRLAGSMDGVNDQEEWVFELKGTSQFRTVQDRGAFPEHVKQVHAYLLASGFEKAVIVYEDKLSQQWSEIEVTRDQGIIDEIVGILKSLNLALDTGKLPEVLDDCQNQTGAKFRRCPYSDKCLGVKDIEEVASAV